jgi:hypothetical protein
MDKGVPFKRIDLTVKELSGWDKATLLAAFVSGRPAILREWDGYRNAKFEVLAWAGSRESEPQFLTRFYGPVSDAEATQSTLSATEVTE